MRIQDEQLKRFVTDAGLVTKVNLASAEKIAKDEKRTLAEALIAGGHMTEDDMRRVESYVLGIPFVSLKGTKIDFDILTTIPGQLFDDTCLNVFYKNI